MDLLFVRFTLFLLPEQAQRAAYAARGAKRLVDVYEYLSSCAVGFERIFTYTCESFFSSYMCYMMAFC